MTRARKYALAFATLSAMAVDAGAQGRTDYINFESPQVKPIANVTINDRRYLLVCNTPDNSVEVYAIDRLELTAEDPGGGSPGADPDFGFCARIPVGLEPVSVTTHSFTESSVEVARMYTANWLSDSVSFVKLMASTNTSLDDEAAFSYKVERQVAVGDEPMCVTVMDTTEQQALFVSKRSASSYCQLDLVTGDPQSPYENYPGATPVQRTGGGADVLMTSTGVFPNPNGMFNHPPASDTVLEDQPMAVKEPHTILARGNVLWTLGQQGGGSKLDHELMGSPPPFPVDAFNLDLWGLNLEDGTDPVVASYGFTEGDQDIGTTNFNMDASADGSVLYVVGTDAMNAGVGNPALLGLSTGFVRTLLYKCAISSSSTTLSVSDMDVLDLNTGVTSPTGSLAHATDVAIYDEDVVAVVAFNSDRFGLVDTSDTDPANWSIELTDLPAHCGPRGLTIVHDPDRAYVMNRLDNTVSILDLAEATPANRLALTIGLQHDPVPAYIRDGQKYLYSTEFSGDGFTSCASCHIDGRSDQQQWRLGPSDDLDLFASIQAPLFLPLGVGHELVALACILEDLESGDGFPSILSDDNEKPLPATNMDCGSAEEASDNAKGPMITQSLQGLLNFEVGGDLFALVTNAPYHWRGDKASFLDFNEAFVNLQGAEEELDEPDMEEFETFINSIHYPPNPLEDITRVYRGDFGTNFLSSTGAQRGMRLFHGIRQPLIDGTNRSCVQCHWLPDGSNNRLTFTTDPADANNDPGHSPQLYPKELKFQPIESAALRGLGPKEGRIEFDSTVPLLDPGEPNLGALLHLRTGDLGTGHEGLNGFSRNAFLQPLAVNEDLQDFQTSINQYVREFDHGVAPIIGQVVTVFPGDIKVITIPGGGGTSYFIKDVPKANLVSLMQAQVGGTTSDGYANAGLVIYVRTAAAGERGYWYRVDLSTPAYVMEPGGSTTKSLSTILGEVKANSANVAIFMSVPLGSERRVALLNDSNHESDFDTGSTTAPGGTSFSFVGTIPNTANRRIPEITGNMPGSTFGPAVGAFLSLDSLDRLQDSAIGTVPSTRHHEAPRRLRVKGNDLRPGAQIALLMDLAGSDRRIELPIYPTRLMDGSGEANRVWETAVEFDPFNTYLLLLGGPEDPQVDPLLKDPTDTTIPNAPLDAGYVIEVRNFKSSWSNLGTKDLAY